jgi:hypothetical protein
MDFRTWRKSRWTIQPFSFDLAKPESVTKPEDRVRLGYRLLFTLDDALRILMKRGLAEIRPL